MHGVANCWLACAYTYHCCGIPLRLLHLVTAQSSGNVVIPGSGERDHTRIREDSGYDHVPRGLYTGHHIGHSCVTAVCVVEPAFVGTWRVAC